MDRAVRIGVELPVLPVGADADRVAAWRSIAVAAERHGAGAVWIADGGCDPCTLAGGLVPVTDHVVLGVVCELAGGRHPAVLARDVTALDVTSGGRAGVLVDGPAPALEEAVTICRALFAGQTLQFSGRHYDVDGAVNRPAPIRPGGPVLLTQSSTIPEPSAAAEPGTTVVQSATAKELSTDEQPAVAGVGCVVTGHPHEIDVATLRRGGPVLWRGRVPDDRFAADLYDAGVDGVIALVETVDDAGPLVDDLVDRWAG
ncbi:MAG TPA: LLM class flavin-dependent oxidoreductase [Acidimicrobiales bacterium]|nr:LLM class flavin-dependent oxidoreductase [Acidimicrobiales bacterium]